MVGDSKDLPGSCQPDDILPLKFWPRAVVDKGLMFETREDLVGRSARASWLQTLGNPDLVGFRLVKVKPSTRVSWNVAHEAWDPLLGTRAMVLASPCIQKKP